MSEREQARRTDAETLRCVAADLTYSDSVLEAKRKHRLYEIAMRIETGYYDAAPATEPPK